MLPDFSMKKARFPAVSWHSAVLVTASEIHFGRPCDKNLITALLIIFYGLEASTHAPKNTAFYGSRSVPKAISCINFCATFTRNFFHKFRPYFPFFSHSPCGKLCGNCAKPCFSRLFSSSFSQKAVENSVKRFLKNIFLMQLFLCFDQKSKPG